MSRPDRAAGRLVHRGQAVLNRPWRWAVTARGRDVTDISGSRSWLVIAPHPDDETLGCGATIARKTAAGTSVRVLIVADGRSSHVSARIPPDELASLRAAEAKAACRALGLAEDQLRLLSWEDCSLGERIDELAQLIAGVVRDVRPDDVVVPSGLDWHPDHQAVNRAGRMAVGLVSGFEGQLLEYPVWHWADGPWTRGGARSVPRKLFDLVREPCTSLTGPRPHLVATGPYMDRKRRALGAYRTQIENLTGEPTWAVLDERFLGLFLRPFELFFPAS